MTCGMPARRERLGQLGPADRVARRDDRDAAGRRARAQRRRDVGHHEVGLGAAAGHLEERDAGVVRIGGRASPPARTGAARAAPAAAAAGPSAAAARRSPRPRTGARPTRSGPRTRAGPARTAASRRRRRARRPGAPRSPGRATGPRSPARAAACRPRRTPRAPAGAQASTRRRGASHAPSSSSRAHQAAYSRARSSPAASPDAAAAKAAGSTSAEPSRSNSRPSASGNRAPAAETPIVLELDAGDQARQLQPPAGGRQRRPVGSGEPDRPLEHAVERHHQAAQQHAALQQLALRPPQRRQVRHHEQGQPARLQAGTVTAVQLRHLPRVRGTDDQVEWHPPRIRQSKSRSASSTRRRDSSSRIDGRRHRLGPRAGAARPARGRPRRRCPRGRRPAAPARRTGPIPRSAWSPGSARRTARRARP